LKKINKEIFIERASNTHNFKYDYSKVNYKNTKTKVEVICPLHGSFYPRPDHHMKNTGCPECSKIKTDSKNRKPQTVFINECMLKHYNKYDYSKTNYTNSNCYIDVVCPSHGTFTIRADHHRNGQGCKECYKEYMSKIQSKDVSKFISESNIIHNHKYDYSKVKYINNYTKVEIICPEHGSFFQKPHDHNINKSGCPNCKMSKGESIVKQFLIDNSINYIEQHRFKDCKNKIPLPFDFYLTDYNICIEYDGKQHFESIEYFGGEKYFETIQINDKIKDQYCINNNISLIRISYKDNMLSLLNDYFCGFSNTSSIIPYSKASGAFIQ